MRVIVAGSRGIVTLAPIVHAMEFAAFFYDIVPSVVLCGDARGVDKLGETWARGRGIVVEHWPAAWRGADGGYNARAGFQRNQQMAEHADALVAVWDMRSKGTLDMIKRAASCRLRLYVHEVP